MKLVKQILLTTALTFAAFSASATSFGAVVDKTKLVEVADILAKPLVTYSNK